MTQLWGVLALRLANAEILPYDFASYGATIRDFLNELDHSTDLSANLPLDSLRRQIAEFETSGRELNDAVARAIGARDLDSSVALRINSELIQVERNWCTPQGIPGRPWWKHSLYGARYTYAHLELPGLTEAAEAGDWSRAAAQAKILEGELANNSALLHEIRRQLDAASGASE
jgi:N-acetylated-alpha-linked acidic dipeptidase